MGTMAQMTGATNARTPDCIDQLKTNPLEHAFEIYFQPQLRSVTAQWIM